MRKLFLVAIAFSWPVYSQIYTQPFTAVDPHHDAGLVARAGDEHRARRMLADNAAPQRKVVQLAGIRAKPRTAICLFRGAEQRPAPVMPSARPVQPVELHVWGSITGVLASQADLNTVLGLKAPLVGGFVPTVNLGAAPAAAPTSYAGRHLGCACRRSGWWRHLGLDHRHAQRSDRPAKRVESQGADRGGHRANGQSGERYCQQHFGTAWGPSLACAAGGPGGSGTVTSVAGDCGITGGPITTAGTLSFARVPHSTSGTTYTILNTDCGKAISLSTPIAAVTFPAPGTGGGFANGWGVSLQNRGNGTVTVTPAPHPA